MMRRLKALALVAALTPLLGACVIYSSEAGEDVSVRVGSQEAVLSGPAPETLRAARFEDGQLIVRADSGGCTHASDFAVSVAEGSTVEITLIRNAPDPCEALLPDGVELRWTYAELGLEPGGVARIVNPVRL